MMTPIQRRSVVKGAAWSLPAMVVSTSAPALAASGGLTDLAIDVALPPTDPASGDYLLTSTLYKRDLTTTATKASLSTLVTITNVGPVAATNPTGTLDLQLVDYGTDVPVAGTEARKFHLVSLTAGVTLIDIAPLTWPGSGRNYSWTYNGTLQPGESLVISLQYWVESPFAHATPIQMLLSGFVQDATDGDYDDNSAKTNYVPSFSA